MHAQKERYVQLLGGCYCTQPKVNPANWKDVNASKKILDQDWYIWYRFYDPSVIDAKGKPKPKLCLVQGMNMYHTLKERREATIALMEEELQLLKADGFNPITGQQMAPKINDGDVFIDPSTPFYSALEIALERLDRSARTKQEIKSNLHFIHAAIKALNFQFLSIHDIRRKHIKLLLNKLSQIKHTITVKVKGKPQKAKPWTNNSFNQYRKNLSILFEELIEVEATDVNPVHGIKKKKHAVNKRNVLSEEQCQKVDDFAREYDLRFWLLIHIFHHSGARTSELFRVQGEHVDLKNRSVKYLVMKGTNYEWVERPIVEVAFDLWKIAMEGCGAKDFVFSKGLVPGAQAINPIQATRRWRRHIKLKLGIECDWYALKHLNTTRNVDNILQEIRSAQETAGKINAHKSSAMVAKVYDIKSSARLNDALKQKSVGLV